MGSNRKLPYGYHMEMGRMVICQEEAKQVRLLFLRYHQGESLNMLTEWLRRQGITYDADKLWNKNIIARILGDSRYRGEKGFPQIIPSDLFISVQELRVKRAGPNQQTEVQKILRQRCQDKVTKCMEDQIRNLLNRLILYPSLIQIQENYHPDQDKITALEAMIEDTLAEMPVNADTARKHIFELAAVRYQAIDTSDYETERLQRLFGQMEPMHELDADLIRKTVSTIRTDINDYVILELKNRQIIQEKRGNDHE